MALLIWGDPSLYDSSLRIAARLDPTPRIRVVPGITALQALTAAHSIPLNELGAPVLVTTGPPAARGLAGGDRDGCGDAGRQAAPSRRSSPQDMTIWWGAFLGMRDEVLVAGPLGEVAERIVALRAEARARHGWIMDTYLLRRRF